MTEIWWESGLHHILESNWVIVGIAVKLWAVSREGCARLLAQHSKSSLPGEEHSPELFIYFKTSSGYYKMWFWKQRTMVLVYVNQSLHLVQCNGADLCQLKSWATVPWAMKMLVALEMTLHLNGIITPQHLTWEVKLVTFIEIKTITCVSLLLSLSCLRKTF